MAWLCSRAVLQTYRSSICYNIVRHKRQKVFVDPIEHATGLEKRELLLEASGIEDPYNLTIKRQATTSKESPNIVYSAFESRVMGCICEEDQPHVFWMWLHEGPPRRCQCGHWFKLVKKPPV